jgi:hypothetical protein
MEDQGRRVAAALVPANAELLQGERGDRPDAYA